MHEVTLPTCLRRLPHAWTQDHGPAPDTAGRLGFM
jgi:hypothetical protein